MSTNSRITKIQSQLSNIADDIRYLMNTSEPMTLQDMGDKISIMREQEWCKPTSGSSSGADVTLGQIDADGNFQPLAFDGQTASNSGDPQTAESYYGWNGTLPSPEGGIKLTQGGNTTYYKCASVDTINKIWTGYLAVLTNGVYTFQQTATTGLVYGTAHTPAVGKVYSSDCTVRGDMYIGFPEVSAPVNPTSDNFQEWIISADSTWNDQSLAYNGFQDSTSIIWHSHVDYPHWIQWQNTSSRVLIVRYSFNTREDSPVTTYALQGSDDGQVWTTIDKPTFDDPQTSISRTIDNGTGYYYHRIYVESGENYHESLLILSNIKAYSY